MSSFGLLKATKLVIVRSSFCNFSMNTKPGNTAQCHGGTKLIKSFITDLITIKVHESWSLSVFMLLHLYNIDFGWFIKSNDYYFSIKRQICVLSSLNVHLGQKHF